MSVGTKWLLTWEGHLTYSLYAVQTKPEAAAHKLPTAFNSNFENVMFQVM